MSEAFTDLHACAMELSLPTGPWDDTAKCATLLASVIRLKSRLKLGYCNNGSFTESLYDSKNCVSFIFASLFNCDVKGLVVLTKSIMNFLYGPINHRKLLISVVLLGRGYFKMA